MTTDELQLMKRAAKILDDIGSREHSHERHCPSRYNTNAGCVCHLDEQEDEVIAVLLELEKTVKENG